MKKLRLKALSLGAKEILNREQLKSIHGGSGSNDPGPCATLGPWCCQCDHMENPPYWACAGEWDGSPESDPNCVFWKNYYCGDDSWGCGYTGYGAV